MLHKTILLILVPGVALWLPYPGICDPVVGERGLPGARRDSFLRGMGWA
jgi:hypothetical protein